MLNRPTFGGHITLLKGALVAGAPMFLSSYVYMYCFWVLCSWSLNVVLDLTKWCCHPRLDEVTLSSPTRSGISGISRCSLEHKIQTYSGPFSFGYLVGGREVVLPLDRWLEWRVVVLGFSKCRGFAASFFSTTPRPPFKGALVAALLCLGWCL